MTGKTTISYYDDHADSFIENTIKADLTEIQELFLQFLPKGAFILDLGCGSGRDTRYFLSKGFQVEAVDGSWEMCRRASEYTGIPVRHMLFQELDMQERYDGIWACASLLHAAKAELPNILRKIYDALKKQGILYLSFKYGTDEGEKNGRYFTNMTEKTMEEILKSLPDFQVEKQWITGDVREGRGEERWLNMILRK